MQIVIEIDEYLYCEVQAYKTVYESHIGEIADAVCKGIPLPKGHGDLIDRDFVRDVFIDAEMRKDYEYLGLDDAPTIIEADVPDTDVGKKGGMTNTELKQILQEIKDDCLEHKVCQGCKFCLYEGCALTHIPDEWDLDKIGLEEGEEA